MKRQRARQSPGKGERRVDSRSIVMKRDAPARFDMHLPSTPLSPLPRLCVLIRILPHGLRHGLKSNAAAAAEIKRNPGPQKSSKIWSRTA